MQRKVVIKFCMKSNKSRSKVLTTAAGFTGVEEVALNGEDQIVVVGDGIDSVALTTLLRKKVGYAELVSVQSPEPEGENDNVGAGGDGQKTVEPIVQYTTPNCNYYRPAYGSSCSLPVYVDEVRYCHEPSLCSIL
ncbi:heavy metal-associated isoprenylated plant protein 46-like [Diospyros lotus]|uniref:heavy metal-associated isoprenylated plant protein 46-like n=1 Tax=Diospyros lotus TaxID=55363 RepID=UPI002254EE13|nr:heavy metal-associated isoprenylated plant protein 46-like [Diospyros lotus]